VNEEDLRSGLQLLTEDSPELSDIRAAVRSRIARRQRAWRALLVTASAAAVAAVAIVATTLLTTSGDASDRAASYPVDAVTGSMIRCYATADLRAGSNFIVVQAESIDRGAPVPAGPRADELCTGLWTAGALTSIAPYVHPDVLVVRTADGHGTAAVPAPPLVSCVLPPRRSDNNQLEVATFPAGATTCADLRLASYGG
jgi:hypothetical protein